MVYFIDKTVYNAFSQKDMTEKEIYFFCDMAGAHRSGKCYLCGDIESLKLCKETLGFPYNNVYNAILQKYSETRAIIEKIKTVFIITMNVDECCSFLPSIVKDKSLIIDLKQALMWNLNTECYLVAENLDDCDFIQLVARYQYRQILNGIDIKFHREHGGGNTTAEVFEKCIVEDKVPTLCITDSDKKYEATDQFPQEPHKGETFKKVSDTNKKLNSPDIPPHYFFPLEVHEMENLIPLHILQELQVKYGDIKDGINMLMKLKNIQDGTPILIYDMKKGFPYIKEEPKRTYWKMILLLLGGSESEMPPNEKDENSSSSIEHKSSFFPALACKSGLLRNSISWMSNNANTDLNIDEYLKKHWDSLSDIVFTWGCVSTPMYS